MRRIAMLLALFALALPASGQNTTIKDLVSGNTYPLTLKLKDLNSEWRRISLGSSDSSGYLAMLSSMMGGGQAGMFYTKGETQTSGSETYLVAYALPAKKVDYSKLMRSSTPDTPTPVKLTEDTQLVLSLVNLRTSGSLSDIRAFDLKREIADSEGSADASSDSAGETGTGDAKKVSTNNLKQIAVAVNLYCQDYDEVLPPMKSAEQLKHGIQPYCKSDTVFISPITHTSYQPNPTLSGKKLKHITDPKSMVLVYETMPDTDNTRGVAYLDGHAVRIPESSWAKLKKASKIP